MAQVERFVASGATGEAMARARSARLEVRRAIEGSSDPEETSGLERFLGWVDLELARVGELHEASCGRIRRRSRAHVARERADA